MPLAAKADELTWRAGRTRAKALPEAASPNWVEPAVKLAAYQDDSRQRPASTRATPAQFGGLIIERDSASIEVRAAQRPAARDSQQAPTDEQTENLFAPMPDTLPPLEANEPDGLDFDMPPQPEDDSLPFDLNRPEPLDRRPQAIPRSESLDIVPGGGPLPERIPTPSDDAMATERERSDEACAQGLSDLQAKTIGTLNIAISVTGAEGTDYPFECSLDENHWHEGRYWAGTTYLWKASALCHKPLFFEDEHLERYGHSWPPCCQPFVSGAHFFTRLPILPYCMGAEPPNECIYALGHYRPGSCAPYMCNPVPLSARGALFQAGAVVGAAGALP